MGVSRGGEFAQCDLPFILKSRDSFDAKELKEREQGMYFIKIFPHDRVIGLITAKNSVGYNLRIAISLESTSPQLVCYMEIDNQSLILGFIVES